MTEAKEIPTGAVSSFDEQGRGMGVVLINGMPYERPVIRVAVVSLDGASCTVPVVELLDVIAEGGPYSVQLKTMSVRDFDAMPEFGGW